VRTLPARVPVRVALVLSAGGLRGAAHAGVLRQLLRHRMPIDAIVGVSAGAVVAAYYAAVGLDVEDLVRDAAVFRGRHLLLHSLNVRLAYRFERRLASRCGVIPERLRQLEDSSFDRLHHGVQRLGIVCHDVRSGSTRYFATGTDYGVPLSAVVRASASIPHLFPPIAVSGDGEPFELIDGGVSDALPLAFARGPAIGATHVIVSDCRWIGRVPSTDPRTVWIRPRMWTTGTLWAPARGLALAVGDGEAAVTPDALRRIRGWFKDDVPIAAAG